MSFRTKASHIITQTRVKELFDFDPLTGILVWRRRPRSDFRRASDCALFGRNCEGRPSGTLNPDGYLRIQIDGVMYLAHILIWVWNYGSWPEQEIDHRDHVRNNNRLANLVLVTRRENMKNKKLYANNRSGCPGVYQKKNRWVAVIRVEGLLKHLGSFASKDDAIRARRAAEEVYSFNSNHGK